MIGLNPTLVSLGAAVAAGLGSRVAAVRFAGARTPKLVVLILLQIVVALSADLLAPADRLAASLLLGSSLALLGVIDALVFRLPDLITLPLIALGLVVTGLHDRADLIAHVIGATAGYAVLAIAAAAYARVRSREGLGLGDAKLMACAGAWLGWSPLPLVLLGAAMGGIAWLAVARLRHGATAWAQPAPFGVPLALAIWTAWLVAVGGVAL